MTLSTPIDPTKAKIQFSYNASNPALVQKTGDGTPAVPYVYTPAPGVLRLWRKSGTSTRGTSQIEL